MRGQGQPECHPLGAIHLGLFEMVPLTDLKLTKYSKLASQKATEMSPHQPWGYSAGHHTWLFIGSGGQTLVFMFVCQVLYGLNHLHSHNL